MRVRREFDNQAKLWRFTLLDAPGNTVLIDPSLDTLEVLLDWIRMKESQRTCVPPDGESNSTS